MKKLTGYILILVVAISSFVSCNDNSTEPEPDKQAPDISVEYPMNNSVVGDTATFKINATDNINISKVSFFIDNVFQIDDIKKPYEYFFNPSNISIGSIHKFYAKAFDDAGNSAISDTITFYYKWFLLVQDEDEPSPRDLDLSKIYVRSTTATIEFRVEMNGKWIDPYDIRNDPLYSIIFLDTDQNPNTGSTPWYMSDFIGPDFMAVIGVAGDSLLKWNSADSNWNKATDFKYLNIENNTNFFEFGINLSDINNPSYIDIFAMNYTSDANYGYFDYAPEGGSITYNVNGSYLGKKNNINLSKIIFNRIYITDKKIGLK